MPKFAFFANSYEFETMYIGNGINFQQLVIIFKAA